MPTRIIHKRDRRHSAHVAKTSLYMMAALAMSGDFAPACLMGMIHQQANRRALQREMHWRRTYVCHEFNWDDFATWNDGECQRLLNFPRDGAEKLGRLFFLPAMQSAPGTDGQLRQDSDGNPFWVT